MARRCKLTDELRQKIVELIAAGNHYEVVCRAVGIGTSTFYRWLEQGREEAAERENVAGQPPVWITTAEAARLTSLPADKLRQAAREGTIRAEKRGRLWFLDRADTLLWASPEGSEFLRFFEAVECASAQAELDLVELWRREAGDWRAVRDFLSRRYPERWGEKQRHHIEAEIQAQADVEMSGKVEHEIEFSQGEVRGALQRFKDFLMQEAIEWERMGMDIEDLLGDGEARSLEEISKVIGREREKTLHRLQEMTEAGGVRKQGDLWALAWTRSTGDDEPEPPPPPEPPLESTPWEPPKPKPPSRQGPIVAGKTHFAQLRDGEL